MDDGVEVYVDNEDSIEGAWDAMECSPLVAS